jgi:hypothetical protein
MKKIPLVVAAALLALLVGSTSAFAASTATANQHPVGGSGIQGSITFNDNGSALTVDGTSTGLTPHVPYFSLIYGAGVGPGGVAENNTLPPTSDAIAACNDFNRSGVSTITITQMVVGFWVNHNDGTGTLHAVKSASGNSQDPLFKTIMVAPGVTFFDFIQQMFGYETNGDVNSYAPIGPTWRTISIRDGSNNFALVACGLVH